MSNIIQYWAILICDCSHNATLYRTIVSKKKRKEKKKQYINQTPPPPNKKKKKKKKQKTTQPPPPPPNRKNETKKTPWTPHLQTSTSISKAWLVTWEKCGAVKLELTCHTKTSWYPNHQYAYKTKYSLDRFNSSQKDQQYFYRHYHKHRSLLTVIPHSVFRNNITWTNFHWKCFSQNEETW